MNTAVIVAGSNDPKYEREGRIILEAAKLASWQLRQKGYQVLELFEDDALVSQMTDRMRRGQSADAKYVLGFLGTCLPEPTELQARPYPYFEDAVIISLWDDETYQESASASGQSQKSTHVRAVIGYDGGLQLPPSRHWYQKAWTSHHEEPVNAIFSLVLSKHVTALLESESVGWARLEIHKAWMAAGQQFEKEKLDRYGEWKTLCYANADNLKVYGNEKVKLSRD